MDSSSKYKREDPLQLHILQYMLDHYTHIYTEAQTFCFKVKILIFYFCFYFCFFLRKEYLHAKLPNCMSFLLALISLAA
jgi:hypothetical protein